MSIPETSIPEIYFLTSRAQHKLTRESVRPDIKLRQLVCHANLVDHLLGELAERRRRQSVITQQHLLRTTEDLIADDETSDDSLSDSDSSEEYEIDTAYTYKPFETMIKEVDEDEDDDLMLSRSPPPMYSLHGAGKPVILS